MTFRIATLNLEQDHKRWDARRELIIEQLGAIRPDVFALNEVCIPQQTARWIQKAARERIGIGDFNATLEMPSAALMATRLRPTQTSPTAFTPLADSDGQISHPSRPRMDRCIDFIWVSGSVHVAESRVCFNQGSTADPTLWPSDHAGVWADLDVGGDP